jgi:malate dehydrogenase (oxaloacetate-decarboxylating)(NADP+)
LLYQPRRDQAVKWQVRAEQRTFRTRRVPIAAKAVAEQVTEQSLASGLIYPPRCQILATSLHVTTRVAETIFDSQLARVARPCGIDAHIRACAYLPVYPT